MGAPGEGNVQPFQRVLVDHLVAGQTRVTWTFARHFLDSSPTSAWEYTLQTSTHGPMPSYKDDGTTARTDDWADAGAFVLNASQLTDPVSRRSYGKNLTTSWRVKLKTGNGTYYSPPASSLGALNKQDWLRAREISRKELLLHKKAVSESGFLLRRKRRGDLCTKCLDPATGDVTLSRCDVCYGTRYLAGWLAAVPAVFCSLSLQQTREHRDLQKGSVMDNVQQGRVLSVPGMESGDLWVAADSDLRYYVHTTGVLAQIRNVPIVLQVELRQADFDDIAYKAPLTGG